ncbi:hypothetical protein E4U27_000188 [Claviceps purpurea]|nr:hypothetical protein E4U27_000188 [Claviceps purpurea]
MSATLAYTQPSRICPNTEDGDRRRRPKTETEDGDRETEDGDRRRRSKEASGTNTPGAEVHNTMASHIVW